MHPSSCFDSKYQISRQATPWNESVIRRRHAIAESDSDSSATKESLPPPPDSLLPNPPSHTSVGKKCSSCSCRKSSTTFKNRNGSCTSVQVKTSEKKSSKNLRLQQLEAKLYNAELQDATQTDKWEKTRDRLHRAREVLEAQTALERKLLNPNFATNVSIDAQEEFLNKFANDLPVSNNFNKVMYLQSLDLKARAMERLTRLSGNLTYKDLNPTETLGKALDRISWDANLLEKLSELQSAVLSVTEIPENVYQLQDELKDKQRDYQTASNTFSQYLRCANKVSTSHLQKFESQYDSIKGKYELSRQNLDREYPKLIDERHNVLQHCFSNLVPLQDKLIEQDKQFLFLTKEISKLLQEPSKKLSCKHAHSEKYLQQK